MKNLTLSGVLLLTPTDLKREREHKKKETVWLEFKQLISHQFLITNETKTVKRLNVREEDM